jgi:hypothetical protein
MACVGLPSSPTMLFSTAVQRSKQRCVHTDPGCRFDTAECCCIAQVMALIPGPQVRDWLAAPLPASSLGCGIACVLHLYLSLWPLHGPHTVARQGRT